MKIIDLALEIFVIYILYKLVFDFIIPIYQTTKKVKQQFGEMQSKMQDHMNKFDGQKSTSGQPKPADAKKVKEDYIDYEEIKD